MFKKISIRWRLTLVSALSLTICCISLTLILNASTFTLAHELQAAIPSSMVTQPTPDLKETKQSPIPATPIDMVAAKKGYSSQSLWIMLLIIMGGSTLTYFLSGKALRPLNHLSSQVKKLTVHTLSNTLEIPQTKDEIAELSKSFKDMKEQLNTAFLSQQRFSANAAHELRTPLAIIQTKIDVFKKKNIHDEEEYAVLIAMFEKQVYALRQLVGNLLDLTTMEDEREKSSVCLRDVLDEIVNELGGLAKQREILLTVTCDNQTVMGNVDLLYRAFYNLIENGIKYNIDGGSVEIIVSTTADKRIKVQVINTGIAIPNEMKKHIFEPFYRVDKSRSRAMGGAGLGLSIVASIIDVHKGTIQVSDHKADKICFEVLL